jgi:hypothetical protein
MIGATVGRLLINDPADSSQQLDVKKSTMSISTDGNIFFRPNVE